MRRTSRYGPALALALAAGAAAPAALHAQGTPELEIHGLLRTGFRAEPESSGSSDAFALFDARLGATGRVGIIFDYEAAVEYDREDRSIRLLDASLGIPLRGEDLKLQIGLANSPVGGEATRDKGEIPFLERSQGSLALAPGRQIGAALHGAALEGRFGWHAGVFNGNGAELENDGDGFLWAARATWNSVGEVEFFEDFVWEVGAGLAFSEDSALAAFPLAVAESGVEGLSPVLVPFTGDRWIWGFDARVGYRAVTVSGEYLRAEFEPDGGDDTDAEGWHVQGAYNLWGAIEWLARYDSFRTARLASGLGTERTEFLVLGLNLLPGLYGRLGLQYAIGLDGTEVGPERALDGTNTGPRLADGQFLLNLQVAF
ncbi:MAG: porin [Gemmatimonadota bacterium]|nr:porin [Gemmatimonadota bacterium]